LISWSKLIFTTGREREEGVSI